MKKYFFTFVLIFVLVLTISCTKTEKVYEFPVNREVIEKSVNEKNLTWDITEEKVEDFRSSFVMKDNKGDAGRLDVGITVVFESVGNDEERYLSAQIIYPNDYSVAQIQDEQAANLPLLIDLSTELYGIGDSSKLIYNEFTKYSDKESNSGSESVLWEYEIKDTHVLLRMSSLNKGVMLRKCAILIMNNTSYEKYTEGLAQD